MSTIEPERRGHTPAEERRVREAALDETIEASFPASDPPSTMPNPNNRDALRKQSRAPLTGDAPPERSSGSQV